MCLTRIRGISDWTGLHASAMSTVTISCYLHSDDERIQPQSSQRFLCRDPLGTFDQLPIPKSYDNPLTAAGPLEVAGGWLWRHGLTLSGSAPCSGVLSLMRPGKRSLASWRRRPDESGKVDGDRASSVSAGLVSNHCSVLGYYWPLYIE
jgi:hypothetical protein